MLFIKHNVVIRTSKQYETNNVEIFYNYCNIFIGIGGAIGLHEFEIKIIIIVVMMVVLLLPPTTMQLQQQQVQSLG